MEGEARVYASCTSKKYTIAIASDHSKEGLAKARGRWGMANFIKGDAAVSV